MPERALPPLRKNAHRDLAFRAGLHPAARGNSGDAVSARRDAGKQVVPRPTSQVCLLLGNARYVRFTNQVKIMVDHLLDNAGAAQLLKISPRTLVKLRDAGSIPYVRLDHASRKGYRYSALALSAWIADHQQRNERPSPPKAGNQ
jgi:hypothetical protein